MPKVFNSRILLIIIAALLISNIAMLVIWYNWSHNDHRPPRGGEMNKTPISLFLEKKVGFTSDQMQQLQTIRKEHFKKLKPMFEDLKQAKSSYYKLLTVSNLPDSQVNAEAMTIALKQQALDIQTFQNFRQLRNICTPQQLPVFDSLMPGMISEMWFPNRRGGGGGQKSPNHDSTPNPRP